MDTIVEQEKTDRMSKSLLRRLTVLKLKGGNFIGEHRNNGRICDKIPKGNYSFNKDSSKVCAASIHSPSPTDLYIEHILCIAASELELSLYTLPPLSKST